MSGKQEREKRRQERLAAEARVDTQDRRKKLLQFGAAAVFLAIAVVAVLIVVAGGDGGGDAANIKDVAAVEEELRGIPQEGMVLGEPGAPVELIEFADLQCPYCKANAEEVLPTVVRGPIAAGKAKLSFRNFVIIGEESEPAGAAALAAGEQGRGFNFLNIFYRNQGKEASGYVTEEFLTAVAEAAKVPDMDRWNSDRNSARIKRKVKATTAEAVRLGFTGTPSFAVRGPGTNGLEPVGNVSGAGELEEAIKAAE